MIVVSFFIILAVANVAGTEDAHGDSIYAEAGTARNDDQTLIW